MKIPQIPDSGKELLFKAADSAISVKFLLILISTALFQHGTLDQSGWIMVILSVSGMRTANELAAIFKGVSGSKGKK